MLALITGLSAMTEWVRGIIEKVAGLVPGTKAGRNLRSLAKGPGLDKGSRQNERSIHPPRLQMLLIINGLINEELQ